MLLLESLLKHHFSNTQGSSAEGFSSRGDYPKIQHQQTKLSFFNKQDEAVETDSKIQCLGSNGNYSIEWALVCDTGPFIKRDAFISHLGLSGHFSGVFYELSSEVFLYWEP